MLFLFCLCVLAKIRGRKQEKSKNCGSKKSQTGQIYEQLPGENDNLFICRWAHTLPQMCVQYPCDSHTPEAGKASGQRGSVPTKPIITVTTLLMDCLILTHTWRPLKPIIHLSAHPHFQTNSQQGGKGKLLFQRNNHNSARSAFGTVSASRRGPWS